MLQLKHTIPWFLIFSRFLSGFVFIYFSIYQSTDSQLLLLISILFQIGFWGDILDGILARKWNVDSTLLRKSDSIADVLFWLGLTFYLIVRFPLMEATLLFGFISIGLIVLIEYLVCLLKFKKTPSAHALISKFWGILLFIFYTIVLSGFSPITFGVIVFCIGIVARLDSLLIYLILNKWTHDIPSCYHATLINKNIHFKKNSLFHSTEKEMK